MRLHETEEGSDLLGRVSARSNSGFLSTLSNLRRDLVYLVPDTLKYKKKNVKQYKINKKKGYSVRKKKHVTHCYTHTRGSIMVNCCKAQSTKSVSIQTPVSFTKLSKAMKARRCSVGVDQVPRLFSMKNGLPFNAAKHVRRETPSPLSLSH